MNDPQYAALSKTYILRGLMHLFLIKMHHFIFTCEQLVIMYIYLSLFILNFISKSYLLTYELRLKKNYTACRKKKTFLKFK